MKTHGALYEYHQIRKDLFWGFFTNGMVTMADPEKAFLDVLYLRYLRGRERSRSVNALVHDFRLEALNGCRLTRYGADFGATMMATLRQLGLQD